MKKLGFTLLEILVVIGIIAILVAMGFASYSTAQKKARDARRKGDLKAIQNSMEQYYSICGFAYPAAGPSTNIICTSPSTAIMPTVPTDPKTGTAYTCSSCGTSGYTLCANSIESESPTGYCVSNQQ